jgi:hypothetical protein
MSRLWEDFPRDLVAPGLGRGETMRKKEMLAYPETIGDLWGHTDGPRKPPSTARLFSAIAAEAFWCLFHTDWDVRIRRIENILSVLKWRIEDHRRSWEFSQLDKLVREAKKEREAHVE